jgi:hypothetical protein
MRPDSDLAEAEGLAAGTGLLTGTVARSTVSTRSAPCPACHGPSEVVVVDLVLTATTMRCVDCGRRWTVQDVPHSLSHP